MWLLLVAAGSGYLARCWHRTLTTKPRLTEYPHVDPEVIGDEQPSSKSSSEPIVEESLSVPNASVKSVSATLGPELAQKPVKRTFSPKTISKLFSSETSKSKKAAKGEVKAKSITAENGALVVVPPEKSSAPATVGHGKKSSWSTFKSKKSHTSRGDVGAGSEEDSGASLAAYLKPSNDSLSVRKVGSKGSSSSRSLHLEDDLNSARSAFTSPGQSSGEFVDEQPVKSSEGLQSGNLQDVVGFLTRSKGESESRPKAQGSPGRSSRNSPQNPGITHDKDEAASRRAVPTSVAEAVAQIEKGNLSQVGSGNAVLQRLGSGKLHAGGAVKGKGQASDGEGTEQILVEEVDISNGGGRGKRRADSATKAKILRSKVALSADTLTGKRSKENKDQSRTGSGDLAEVTLASITGKRMKDGDKTKRDSGDPKKLSPSIAGGIVDLSQVFFGFDSTFLGSGAEEKSPMKFYKKSRYGVKTVLKSNVRRMRESPKPVSALESCLMAQFPEREEGSRVARALNFSSLPSDSDSRRESVESNFEEVYLDGESASTKGSEVGSASDGKERDGASSEFALGLPVLKAIPSKRSLLGGASEPSGNPGSKAKYPRPIVLEEKGRVASSSKLDDVLWRSTALPVAPKKRKVSQACTTAAISCADLRMKGYELEALVIPPMEGLLFSFGVGIGVMSLIGEPEKEVERLTTELQKSEHEINNLNELLRAARDDTSEAASAQPSKQVMVVGSISVEKVTGEVSGSELVVNRLGSSQSAEEGGADFFDLVRKEAPETPQQTEHLAELEAELEAELDALTGGIPDGCLGPLDFAELDPEGMAGVANRDLGVEGLPALLDWDDDNDDFITEDYIQGSGVPPRELRRLLRKVQSSREELRIAELEVDLEESEEKLKTTEMELHRLREALKSMQPQSPSTRSVHRDARDLSETGGSEMSKIFDGSSPGSQPKKGGKVLIDGEKSPRRDRHAFGSRTVVIPSVFQGSEKLRDDSTACLSPKWESAGGLRAAISRKLGSSPLASTASHVDTSLQRSTSVELGSTLRKLTSIELGSSILNSPAGRFSDVTRPPPSDLALLRGTTSGSILKEWPTGRGDHSTALNDNDAVCDEFLSSVLGSSEEEDNLSLGSSVSSHPGNPTLPKTFSLDDSFEGSEEGKSSVVLDREDVVRMVRAKSTEEDLDQVVDKLLKRDSSSVKNAISAFLQWEAETDEEQEKDDAPGSVGETSPRYQRRTGGKLTTPQKPISSSSSPLRTAVLASRLEELARTTSSGSEKTYSDKLGFSTKMKSGQDKTKKSFDEDLDVFQPLEPQAEDRIVKTPGRKEYQLTKKERSPRTREGRKSLTESRRELFKKESPVFGSVDVDLDSLMDMRREKRYSSSKVELSSSAPPRERDVIPSGFRPREDSSRAGTNSPTERLSPSSVRLFYPSPKPRSSRASLDKRLYHNLTSDWIADVGSKTTGKN